MTPGSPDTPLTAPDMHILGDTKADGNCLFRAFSVLLTGTEHAHRKVRLAIDQHLLDNGQLFIPNAALDCSDHNSMDDYIVAYQMRHSGWGGVFALVHMIGQRMYNSSRVSRSWNENCPTLIDSPKRKEALYIYHMGDHYKVVMSSGGSRTSKREDPH